MTFDFLQNNNNKYLIYDTIKKNFDNKNQNFMLKINRKSIDHLNYKFHTDSNNNNIITIFDKEKELFTCTYSIIGLYNYNNLVWYWSWNVAAINKQLVQNKKNIKLLKNFLIKKYEYFNSQEIDEYYYYVKNNNFHIINNDIIKLVMIALYISNAENFLEIISTKNNIKYSEFILLEKIIKIK